MHWVKVFIRCFKPWGSDFAEIHCRGECHGPVELVFMCRLSVRCCVGGVHKQSLESSNAEVLLQ